MTAESELAQQEEAGARSSRSTFFPRRGRPERKPRLERRSFFATLWRPYPVPSRNDEDSLRAKLAALCAWMSCNGKEVPACVTKLLSTEPAVQQEAARELWTSRQAREQGASAQAEGPRISPEVGADLATALHLALAECEARTAPVTGRSVSAVEDPWYIGYQRRRTLSARLWGVALLSFAGASIGDFANAWVAYRRHHGLGEAGSLYPEWTVVVGNYVVEPTSLFLWGLLGASLYLLRRLYQFTEARTFDHRLAEMYSVRLLMGGVAGALLALVVFPPSGDGPEAAKRAVSAAGFGSHALAIVGGFSVRAVYSVLERIAALVREQLGRPPKAASDGSKDTMA